MDNLNSKKKPYFIKKIYKSNHGTLLGLPKKLSQELKLDNETYVRMYYDRENKMVLLTIILDELENE
jgi:hypothetical protein